MKRVHRKPTTDAAEILYREFYDGRPARIASLERERENDAIACKIRDMRRNAGLSQNVLAKLVGTTPSVISRLENANYRGHSLFMLRRIAHALRHRVRIVFESAA